MSRKILASLLSIVCLALLVSPVLAGANLKINDEASINFGYRLQTYFTATKTDLDGSKDGYESYREFSVRRARFRLKGTINEKVSVFMQTDVSTKDMQMIDAFITYKADRWAQFIMGRNMAPSSRQVVTSSGALMAMDRPGNNYKSLNWGARTKYRFNGSTFYGADVPATPDAVRDNGLTLFGSGELGSGHLKYYAGIYNGVQEGVEDNDHMTFRAQYNFWDAEPGYYNSSTYLGKKKTLGIGISYDVQAEVGDSEAPNPADPDIMVDYTLISIDGFLEYPTNGGNAITAEGAWTSLDFDDAPDFMVNQGSGYYFQAGYYLNSGWQPWFEFEGFSSDATAGTTGTMGDYTSFRVGLTYYIDGQHANVKLGYESFKPDVPFSAGATQEDTVNSLVLGFFTNY